MKKTTKARGYGSLHKRRRELLEPLVAGGGVNCARCGKRIRPGQAWDLDHDDYDRGRYLGPSHRACNRSTSGRREEPPSGLAGKRLREDEPARGVFWGPPELEGGRQLQWSRVWFDWRNEREFMGSVGAD